MANITIEADSGNLTHTEGKHTEGDRIPAGKEYLVDELYRNGVVIHIEHVSEAAICIEKRSDDISMDYSFVIYTGTFLQINTARQLLNMAVSQNIRGLQYKTIYVPEAKVRAVLGPDGKNKIAMKHTSGTNIILENNDLRPPTKRTVAIRLCALKQVQIYHAEYLINNTINGGGPINEEGDRSQVHGGLYYGL